MVTAITAVAPAGACIVLVACMRNTDTPTLMVTAMNVSHRFPIKRRTRQPTIALITCPPMTFRGCDNGLDGSPYTSAAVAPNEAIKNVKS